MDKFFPDRRIFGVREYDKETEKERGFWRAIPVDHPIFGPDSLSAVYGDSQHMALWGLAEGVESMAQEMPTAAFALGQTVAIENDKYAQIDALAIRNGEVVYGVIKNSPQGVFESVYWYEPEKISPVDTTFIDNMPDQKASSEEWFNWIDGFARNNLGPYEDFFSPRHNETMFYSSSITRDQEIMFKEVFIQFQILNLRRTLPTASNGSWRMFIRQCKLEAARAARRSLVDFDTHDNIIHMAVAIARRGADEPLDLPAFALEKHDEYAVTAEEIGAIAFGFNKPSFLRKVEEKFLTDFSLEEMTAERFTGYLGRAFQADATSKEGHYAHGDSATADQHYSAIEKHPPAWLIDIVWPLITEHPDSLYNKRRLAAGLVSLDQLNPQIGPELLESILRKKLMQ